MIRVRVLAGIVILVVVAAACGGEPATVVSHGGPVTDYVSLIDGLRAAGATVEPAGTVDQPFFTVQGRMIAVDGRDVQVFEYPDAASMEDAAGDVSADGGSVGTSMIGWVEPPHFYKTARLVVLYVGTDAGVMQLLEDVLGEQFAGR